MAWERTAAQVYKDGPSGTPSQPAKDEIRPLLKQYEEAIDALGVMLNASQGAVKALKTQLLAIDDDFEEGDIGVVFADTDSNNGVYVHNGTTFVKDRGLPGSAADAAAEAAELYSDQAKDYRDTAKDYRDTAEEYKDLAAGYASDAVSQGNVPIYSTISGMSAITVPAGIAAFRVNGRAAVGDIGVSPLYTRVTSEPSHPGKVRTADRFLPNGTTSSANGGWWELTDAEVSAKIFASLLDAKTYVEAQSVKKTIAVDGTLTISDPIEYDNSRGDMWRGATEISNLLDGGSGITYSGNGKTATITSATNSATAVFTASGHSFVNGDIVFVVDGDGGTWGPALNGGPWTIADVSGSTFRLKTAAGAYLNGSTLGTLTTATARTVADMTAIHLTGSFGQTWKGFTLQSTTSVESLLWVGANDYIDTSDFSGSVTAFHGIQFRPEATVTQAAAWVENHKFAEFSHCWFARGTSTDVGLHIGGKRNDNRRALLQGIAMNTTVKSSFFFADVEIENCSGVNIIASQFDGTDDPVRLFTTPGGSASCVHIDTVNFTNDGGADGTGLPGILQGYATQQTNALLPFSGAWTIENCDFRDWPIAMQIEAGMCRISANQIRGRDADNKGIVFCEKARGEVLMADNDFSQTFRAGNVSIEDKRYKTLAISSISKANPCVVTFSSGQDLGDAGYHFENGDRIRLETVGGMTEVNNKEFIVQGATATTVQLYTTDDCGATSSAVNSTSYTTYTSGGTAKRPYMWHRHMIDNQLFSLGHGDMVFDLALDQFTTLSATTVNVLNMANVPITGGHYEVTYGAVVGMGSTSGDVKFDIVIDGVSYAQSSFSRTSAGTDYIHHFFQRRIPLAAVASTTGSVVRFRCVSPGTINLRGKSSTSLGLTFCQIRRVQ